MERDHLGPNFLLDAVGGLELLHLGWRDPQGLRCVNRALSRWLDTLKKDLVVFAIHSDDFDQDPTRY